MQLISHKYMYDHYFSETRIAFASLVVIMVLTGVTLGIGFSLSSTTPTGPTPIPIGISKNSIR